MRTWTCPYFSGSEGRRIECEGAKLNFKSRETYLAYAKAYCSAVPGWEGCVIAQRLGEAYREAEGKTDFCHLSCSSDKGGV